MSVTVLTDRSGLMRAAAERLVTLASEAIKARGRFDWALAGGSTPEQLYALLASPEYRARIEWSRVHVFWGDERCVPPDHAESNFGMAKRSLLDAVALPASNIHRMPGELEPEAAAASYQAELERHFASSPSERAAPGGFPRFDSILLGMGGDGHTASLFPGTAALDESRRWVVANGVPALGVKRLTLTLPVLDAAAQVMFLVAGADKAARLKEVLSTSGAAAALPAARVRPHGSEPEWLVDAPAAARLEGGK